MHLLCSQVQYVGQNTPSNIFPHGILVRIPYRHEQAPKSFSY